MPELKKLFDSIDDATKMNFLWDVLQQDEKINKKFLEVFFEQWEAIRFEEPAKYDIQKLLKEIKEDAVMISGELSELDFENLDWDLWESPGYYVPDYEAAQMIAQEMADQAVEGLLDKLNHEIEFGDLTRIVAKFATIAHGFFLAEINDPDDNLYDHPNDYFIEKVKNLLQEEKARLASRKFLATDFNIALELFFKYQKVENCGDQLLYVFSDFFLSLVQRKDYAESFWDMTNKYQMDLTEYPTLLSQVVSLLDNKQLWVKTMENVFLQDYQSSEDLMAYYYEFNPEKFRQKAAPFFEKYKSKSYDFLFNKVEEVSPLHVTILTHAAVKMNNLDAFVKLKEHVSSDEIFQLIESENDPGPKIKLWNQEGRYDKIEEVIAEELKDGTFYDRVNFVKSIQYLYLPQPDAAIHLTEKKIDVLMGKEKNRDTYRYIAQLLNQSLSIPGKQDYVKSIALGLYNHKPNLPALKDELRKAGLV